MKGVLKYIFTKLSFIEQRAAAVQASSIDQVRHGFQAWDEGGLSELTRHTVRELVRTGERQSGVGLCCCPCWSALKGVDLTIAVKDQLWMRREARRREREGAQAAPGQEQMAPPAPARAPAAAAAPAAEPSAPAAAPELTLAKILNMLNVISEAIKPGHPHAE